MSVIALNDILFGDLLTETGMKPWWEKVRGYIFASGVALALSSTYLTLNGVAVDCLPLDNENINGTCNVDAVQAAWINTYCSIKIPWYVRFSGGMSLLAVVIMLAVSSYWLYIPEVIDSFVSFVETVKIIYDSDMTLDELCEISVRPQKKEDIGDSQLKLRKVCDEKLRWGKEDIKLKDVYQRRNCLLLGASFVVVTTFTFIVHFMISLGDEFHCNISTNNLYVQQTKQNFPETVVCVSLMAHHLAVFNILFTLSVVMQTVPIVYFVCKHGGRVSNKGPTQQRQLRKNIYFLSFFYQRGQPKWSAKFSRFVDYLSGTDAELDILNSLEDVILLGDDYVIRSFFLLTENASDLLIHTMYGLYQSALNENIRNDIEDVESKIATVLNKYVVGTFGSKYYRFLESAISDRNWKLTARVVNLYVGKLLATACDAAVEGFNLLRHLDINYDILDENGCSFMHYVLAMPNMHTISELLSNKYHEKRRLRLYAHYNGRSVVVSSETDIDEKLYYWIKVDFKNTQKDIDKYYKKFKNLGDSPADHQRLNEGLSRIKFHEWDENAKKFAIKTNQKRDWETFVTLLNCYIIADENENSNYPLICGVTEGIETAALFSALSYPKPFVPTAAKHIIACFTRDQRDEASKILENCELRDDDRKKLEQFLSECDFAPEHQSNFAHSAEPLDTGSNQSCAATENSTAPNINGANSDSNSTTITIESASDTEPLIAKTINVKYHTSAKED